MKLMNSVRNISGHWLLAIGVLACLILSWGIYRSPQVWVLMPALGLYTITTTWLYRRSFSSNVYGKTLLAWLSVAAIILGINQFAFYFFAISKLLIIGSLVVTLVVGYLTSRFKHHEPFNRSVFEGVSTQVVQIKNKKWAQIALVIFTVILNLAMVLSYLQHQQHVYQGALPDPVPAGLTSLVFLGLFGLMYVGLRPQIWVGIAMLTFFCMNSFFVTNLDNLFSADSWRHVGKSERVLSGKPYQPTNFSKLLKFENEKVPNASLYTAIPVLSVLSGTDSVVLFRWLSIVLLGPLAIWIVFVLIVDLTHNTLLGKLGVLSGFSIGSFLGIEGYLTTRIIGLVLFVVVLWLALRIAQSRARELPYFIWALIPVALLAYPTSGYFSLVVILLAIGSRLKILQKIGLWVIPLIIVLVCIIAWPLPARDVSYLRVNNASEIHLLSNETLQIIRNSLNSWFTSPWSGQRPLYTLMFLFSWGGLVYLYRRSRSTFIVLASVYLALLLDTSLAAIFGGSYAPFSSRIFFLFSILATTLSGIGLGVLLRYAIERRLSAHLIAVAGIVVFSAVTANNPAIVHLGWSPSRNEVESVKKLIQQERVGKYIVLTDETTAAVGYALAKNDEQAFYWFPATTPAWNSYIGLLKTPSVNVLRSACAITSEIKNVYFINTPIPPTSDLAKKALPKIKNLMKKITTDGPVEVYRYSCSN